MKHKMVGTALTGLFAVALMPSMAATAQAQGDSCSVEGAAGTYGVSDSGTIVGLGPRAAVALLTLDAEGDIKGKITASLNGSVSNTTLSGTYDVNRDCTGTTTFGEYDTSGSLLLSATAALVWDADMSEFRFLFTSALLPNGTTLTTVINGDARKTDQPQSQQNAGTASPSVSDDTPGIPQTVSPSGTGAQVQLVPTGLGFLCTWGLNCPPPTQTVTLTNVGSTTLDITSITITASFYQRNTCGSSLASGKSCTITVWWKVVAPFRGTLSISDNGGGSPQQVSLEGAIHSK